MTDAPALAPALASLAVTRAVTRWFGPPTIAALPAVHPDGDHADAFQALLRSIEGRDVVLFPDVWPGHLDAFFHLRLGQILSDQPPVPTLAVIVLAADIGGPPLAGGFADRFRTAWPFARCAFVTESGGARALSDQLGLPVGDIGDDTPRILRTQAAAGQPIALQLQMTWGRCGSTTLFENQIESLVQAGFFTLRLFWNAKLRRGPTVTALLDQIVPENSTHAGAHIDLLAVPPGPPDYDSVANAEQGWASWLRNTARCQVRDTAATRAAERADVVIANHLDTVGTALRLAPAARLLLDVHDDRAAATRLGLEQSGLTPAEIDAEVATAEGVQAAILGIPDICAHISVQEAAHLGPQSQRAVVVLPRLYTRPAPLAVSPRFDVLLAGDGHPANIASLQWFLDAVWRPYLEPARVRVAVVGRAGQRIDAAAYLSPTLHFLGFVEDLDTFRTWCRVSVVPDRAGTGVSIKLLTILAAGHPLVTTGTGLRGLDPAIVGDLPAHDDPAGFANDVLGLLRDPERLLQRHRLVTRAQEAIRRGPTYADLLRSVPAPDAARVLARATRWEGVVAAAPAEDTAPYCFVPDAVFPMSGCVADRCVLIDGWHEAEPWGRWTDGTRASMRIVLPAPTDEPLKLELDINPSPIGAALALAIDGSPLPPVDPVAGVNAWFVPSGAISEKPGFVLTLMVADSMCPARAGNSADTRVLGIGVRTVRLTRARPTPCVPGEFLPVNSDSPPNEVLTRGWHALEPWGCWSNGRSATLRLSVPAGLRGATLLELDLQPTPGCGALTLTVNGWTAPPQAPHAGINRWNLPVAVTEAKTELLVTLSLPDGYCPAVAEGSADDRILGIGLRRVRLSRHDPVRLVPGRRLGLGASTDLTGILESGWHKPESWGCWSNCADALVRLTCDRALLGGFRLDLELSVTPACTALALVVNGVELPAIVPVAGTNSWHLSEGCLPEGCLAGTGDVALRLRVAELFCPVRQDGSGDDRVLGIGLRAVTLHQVAASVCPVGPTVYVGAGHDDHGALADGWHRREDWGCWSAGNEATLRLRLAEPLPAGSSLVLEMTPPLIDLTVGVSVNGIACEDMLVLDGPNEWSLPPDATEGQAELLVRLQVDRPVRPNEVMRSKDDRLLGVGIRAFALVPGR